ncbi:MAG: restriction endonuclease [Anaerolineae bacterium]|nr:restriction endonuclease [Anaerolineae bacterium]
MKKGNVPQFDFFMNPILEALKILGGSGTIEEIDAKVAEITHLTDAQLAILHDPEKGGQSEVAYRMAWARTYLKKASLLENSSRGVWALTPEGQALDEVEPTVVKKYVRGQHYKEQSAVEEEVYVENQTEPDWREELLGVLLQINPSAFERLIQRLLREAGFIQVEVTGRSGDGGIDGRGIMRLGGLLSFHVLFQCKRYQGAVSASQVRDFRGALIGRADKGLFITTGNFTKDATKEATRDGATPIDLINGERLVEKLRELQLGVKVEKIEVEKVTINRDWFLGI